MRLISTNTSATTYNFRTTGDGFRSWALCTVNDATGELLITSDWGNWAHRWSIVHLGTLGWTPARVENGDPGDEHRTPVRRVTLTEFIARGFIDGADYIARKLQGSRGGRRFSAVKTVVAWRRALCEQRLRGGTSLTRELAREIWDALGEAADTCGDNEDAFLSQVYEIDGFTEHVDDTPYESLETEQTPEDRALREQILPALIAACAETHRARTAAPAEGAPSP